MWLCTIEVVHNIGPIDADRQMDGRYQTHYLHCFEVNKHDIMNFFILIKPRTGHGIMEL